MPEADECMSGDHVTLRDSSSGGPIICTTKTVPYVSRMREHLNLCPGIMCTPEDLTKAHCDARCELYLS